MAGSGVTLCCAAVVAALQAKAVKDKPTLIKVSTLIGYGSPNKADSHDVHGAPLGAEETAATRKNLGWNFGEFEVPKVRWQAPRVGGGLKGVAAERLASRCRWARAAAALVRARWRAQGGGWVAVT
jgi:hypothetical protein